jgi:putative sterol carrier protein
LYGGFEAYIQQTTAETPYNKEAREAWIADIWLAVAEGKLDGQQAFMSGKYTVVGDISLLFKLKALFSR